MLCTQTGTTSINDRPQKKFAAGLAASAAQWDLHVHLPAGAVQKDGPSAGITLAAALASLFAERCARADTAMTGELTLRGLVLPVGGIKEKLLAAHQAGMRFGKLSCTGPHVHPAKGADGVPDTCLLHHGVFA